MLGEPPPSPIEEAATEETAPIGGPLEEPSTPQTPCEEQTTRVEASSIQFLGWREVLHPSRQVTTSRQAPLVSNELRQRPHSQSLGGRKAQHQRVEKHQQAEETRQESASSPKPLEAVQKVALPPGFKEVMACLQRHPWPEIALEAPLEPLQLEIPIELAIATMCASCIVQDEAMGITYMDTVTTSVG